jgi:predicted dehydrogenase
MLERKDIDCVIIGTPDHWHALNLVHACEAGKDIYCEKPISHNLVEANAMMAAKRRFKRVVQVGTWQRSTPEFHNAMEYIRSGKLGKVVHCKAWINDGAKLGHREPEQPPAGFDYDAWIGPAKMVPYRSNCVHFNWRYIRNTGGGHVTDWGVHMMDIALLGMSAGLDLPMPTSVAAVGGLYDCEGDDRDCMNLVESVMKFDEPNFSMYWTVLRDPKGLSGNGTEWVNAAGETVRCYRGGWEVLDKGGKKMPTPQADPLESDHSSNFLDCVKSREKPRGDLESVGQSTVVCHLVNVAMESGETVKFDKKTMDIVGRAGKNTLAYSRTYRKGYKLPIYK